MPAHKYYVDGKRVPGVTTVLGVEDKPGLKIWAFNQGKLAAREEDDMRSNGLEVKELGLWDMQKDALNIGTLTHKLIEDHIGGEDSEIDAEPEIMEPAIAAFEEFKSWQKDCRFELVEAEISLTSKEWGFGGSMDAAMVHGRKAIVDWKTGRMYSTHGAQLAGYRQLYVENRPDEMIEDVYVLVLSKTGDGFRYEKISGQRLRDSWTHFLRCLALYNSAKVMGKHYK